jgi:hypothetical protein
MASTPRIPKAEITGLYGWMLKRLSRKLLGEVPEAATSAWGAPTGVSRVNRRSVQSTPLTLWG